MYLITLGKYNDVTSIDRYVPKTGGRLGKIEIVCFRINSFVKSSRPDKNGNCSVLIESTIALACLISLVVCVCEERSKYPN